MWVGHKQGRGVVGFVLLAILVAPLPLMLAMAVRGLLMTSGTSRA
jgi:hypothetical protein